MSLWNDFWDGVENIVEDVGDTISNAWDAIKHNPIGAITSAVAMAYGIPPMWAGALGGATGAAASGANGGDILKAAVTGAAMGEMGYQAADFAGAAVTPAFGATAGTLAAGAAGGAAAGVTGAILTGQNVADAAKAGLILGTVIAGGQRTYHIMTAGEAISSVPVDAIARANATSDPIAALANEMGWIDSVSATNAASQSIQDAKNSGALKTYYADQIPDDVLAKAMDSANPAQTVAKEMGWTMNGPQAGGIYEALGNYEAANTPALDVPQTQTQAIVNTGLVNSTDAAVLANNGYSASDVQNLVKLGYTPADLTDMAVTGVSANTLTNLARTPFAETTIDSMLTNGVSANDISNMSAYVNSGKVSLDTATSLLNHGVTGYQVANLANSGQSEIANQLLNKGVTPDTISKLTSSNVNLGNVNNVLTDGKLSTIDLNNNASTQNWSNTNWNAYITRAANLPTPVVTPESPASDLAKSIKAQYPNSVASASDIQHYLDKGFSVQEVSNAVSWNPDQSLETVLGTATPINQPVQPTGTQFAQGPTTETGTVSDTPSSTRWPGNGIYNAEFPPPGGGTNLATQADIDAGNYEYVDNGDGTSTMVRTEPQKQEITTPIVPPTETPTTTPTEVAGPVTPPSVEAPQLIYTSDVTLNGTPYSVEHYNDGTSVYTDLNNGGKGYTAGDATNNGSVPVTPTVPETTVKQPTESMGPTTTPVITPQEPLSPVQQQVIPPGTSQVTPVEVPTNTVPVTDLTPSPVEEKPPVKAEVLPEDQPVQQPPEDVPYVTPIIPITEPIKTPVETPAETYGHYTLGTPVHPNIPTTLNPGWITNVPAQYQTTNEAQSKYYWGGHPYQTGTTFNPTLYKQSPNAPQQAWGLGYAQTSATPQQIMQRMGTYTPYYTTGPVAPV